jgi:methylglyoxal/glyoxal reductase
LNLHSTKTLNNEVKIPYLGFGVFQVKDGQETVNAVHWAIESGYRHVDTATAYANEKNVGQAIRDSGINRDEIFVTTKLWKEDMVQGTQMKAFEKSLKLLQTDYVDLYLIHWPVPGKTLESWKVLEEIYKSGRARAIGVSNFVQCHLDLLLQEAEIVPAVNQIQCHPHFTQQPLVAYCKKMGIACEAWSPLGGTGGNLLDDTVLKKISEKYAKSVAQIVLRWDLQRHIITIPKSIHQARIIINTELYEFELSKDDVNAINELNQDIRPYPTGWDPNYIDF